MAKRFKLKEVIIDEVTYLEKNANYMDADTYRQLVSNIRRDGELSTIPFCILHTSGSKEGKYEVISGNHRVKAAKDAGLVQIYVLYCLDTEISNDEKLAIQLSHNEIHGQNDLEVLKELVEEIQSAEYKEYAYVDESQFAEIGNFEYDIASPTNEIVHMTFTFFDIQKVSFDKLAGELDLMSEKEQANTHILPKAQMAVFNEVVGKVQEKFKIKSYGLAVAKMVELVGGMLNGKDKNK
jgi:hypothetical protein